MATAIQFIKLTLGKVKSENRETWLKVGSALKSELGDDGFKLWDEWSGLNPKYEGSEITKKAWNSLKSNNITIATLFMYAESNNKSLIITGSQGDGKTTLAKYIACNSHGHYSDVHEELSVTQMKQMIANNPGKQFIFTSNERLSFPENNRCFIIKTVNELTSK